jgi:hypothetical protein
LRIFARAKADNSTYSVASLRKLINAPPSRNPPMRNKTWQLRMLSRTMKRLQTATTTYIYNGPGRMLNGENNATIILLVDFMVLEVHGVVTVTL